MIALSAYKLANYLVETIQPQDADTPNIINDIKWETVIKNKMLFLEISDTNFRNSCFCSIDQKNPKLSYFYKQPKCFSKENIDHFKRESYLYLIVKRSVEVAHIKSFFPNRIYFDATNIVLVTHYHEDALPLTIGESRFYGQIGTYLAQFHKTFTLDYINKLKKRNYPKKWFIDFENQKPYIITLKDYELEKLAKNDNPYVKQLSLFLLDIKTDLLALNNEWVDHSEGLIHGDTKDNNFIITRTNNIRSVTILDFELSCIGAWFWDVAIFVASLLSKSIVPTTTNRGGTSSDLVFDLIKLVCKSYFQEKGISPSLSDVYEKMILKWAGIYFLQTFLQSEKIKDLENGFALLSKNNECWNVIFNRP